MYWTLDEEKNIVPIEVVPNGSHFFTVEKLLRDVDFRHVGETKVGDYLVSTVFLVIAHCPNDGDFENPDLFETMVFEEGDYSKPVDFTERTPAQMGSELLFGRDVIGNSSRYKTWQEAVEGHEMAVRAVATFTGMEPQETTRNQGSTNGN